MNNKSAQKIIRFNLLEFSKNRWILMFMLFYFSLCIGLYLIDSEVKKVLVSINNISLAATPLISILFGSILYYNSKDFIILLMSQPIARWTIFRSLCISIIIVLCASILLGIGLPMLFMGALSTSVVSLFFKILLLSSLLSIIFSLIGFWVSMYYDDRIKGLSISIFIWLFFTIIYDGIVLLIMLFFRNYPLDQFSIFVTIFNPIDMARILINMDLDGAAMMGYTGAVIIKFLGSTKGSILIFCTLLAWILIPYSQIKKLGNKKDF